MYYMVPCVYVEEEAMVVVWSPLQEFKLGHLVAGSCLLLGFTRLTTCPRLLVPPRETRAPRVGYVLRMSIRN